MCRWRNKRLSITKQARERDVLIFRNLPKNVDWLDLNFNRLYLMFTEAASIARIFLSFAKFAARSIDSARSRSVSFRCPAIERNQPKSITITRREPPHSVTRAAVKIYNASQRLSRGASKIAQLISPTTVAAASIHSNRSVTVGPDLSRRSHPPWIGI